VDLGLSVAFGHAAPRAGESRKAKREQGRVKARTAPFFSPFSNFMASPALRALKARTPPYSLRFFNPIVLISWLMSVVFRFTPPSDTGNRKHFDGVQ
jgi:hypothetical protein